MAFFDRRRHLLFATKIERVAGEIARGNPKSLLDVGGGDGMVTEAVGPKAARLVVVEPNARTRAKGAKRRPRIDFMAGAAETLPCADSSFDCVMSFVAFHHFHDQGASLREMRRVLVEGGRLVIFEFRPDQKPGRFWRLFVGHTHFLEQAQLSRIVKDAGFSDVVEETTPMGYYVVAKK